MKRIVVFAIVTMLTVPMTIFGQTYSALWKKAEEAGEKDLPRTQYDVLMQIVSKADKERNYGQLLRAELKGAQVMTTIAPDSLLPAVERMEARWQTESDDVMRTVYQTVLHRVCRDNPRIEKSIAAPELTPELCLRLGAVKAETLQPVVIVGRDSRIFENDLLSVVGMATEDFTPLHDYYERTDNRRAALITALELLRQQRPAGRVSLRKADYLQRVDSLVDRYADLAEAGEAVIEHYKYMDDYTDATDEEKWQYINWALGKYGSWQRMNVLRQAQADLTSARFEAATEFSVALPGQPQEVKLTGLRSLTELTMRVYQAQVDGDTKLNPDDAGDYKKLKPLLTELPELSVKRQYIGKKPYERFDDSLTLQGLPVGVYMVEMETVPHTATTRRLYFVSDVRVMSQALPDSRVRYVVVNATTGQPLKGATVKIQKYAGYQNDPGPKSLTTDAQGEAVLSYKGFKPVSVFAYTDGDKACPPSSTYGQFSFHESSRLVENVSLFTDRAIYRPGQTVHVAVLGYRTIEGFMHSATSGLPITLRLYDANHKEVSSQQATTDRFGMASADFTLPQGLLTGRFYVSARGSSASFRVEEYKRPTFEVEFPKVTQAYEDGDTLVVRAVCRSYSGVPVQGAKVSYRVVRRHAWWWLSYSNYWGGGYSGVSSTDEQVAEGEAMTAHDGTFAVEMPMHLPPTTYPMFYNFVCIADVTDQAGETHQGQLSLPLGNRKTAFTAQLADQILKESPTPLTFQLRNAAGIGIDAAVKYRINGGKWLSARTQTELSVVQPKSGKYTLEAICEGDTLERTFTVFSINDRRPATQTDDWFYVSASAFPRDGQPVTLQVGSSDENLHIVYSLISGNRVLESGAVKKSAELLNRKLTYKSEYGDGLLVTYAWVKNGRCHIHQAQIQRPLPDKRLLLEWQTFRNRLTPGQAEEWTLTVKKPDGTPADAQLLAVLYDKSLDQLAKHRLSFVPFQSLSLPYTQWQYAVRGSLFFSGYRSGGRFPVRDLVFSRFDDAAFPSYWSSFRRMKLAKSRAIGALGAVEESVAMASAPMAAPASNEMAVMDSSAEADGGDSLPSEAKGRGAAETDGVDAEVQVRENLQETAFFYPQLVADSTGCVALRFTLPESLTTWRFMGLAHTPDLCYGQIDGEAVARKDVMIQPNVPRFLREGDHGVIAARLFNTGDKTVKSTVRLQLVDPETETVVYEASQAVVLPADSTTSTSFAVDVAREQLSRYSLLVCKMTVSGQGFSDGEQHYLPVLSNRERVTVTVPFTQQTAGTTSIDVAALFPSDNTADQKKLTFEYTNNPVWLMIQALPSMAIAHDDCAVCQAASFYANSIGRHIMAQAPHAQTVFEQWRREAGMETSLQSALEKNQELKDLVLSETPWLADADRETEQKHRVADFFDANLMQQRLASATAKLGKLQHGDGSWGWWPDMPGSLHMTVCVTEMLVRLNEMTQRQETTAQMLSQAMKYLGQEMVKLVRDLKKEEKKGHSVSFPNHAALQWLYICTLDGRHLPASVTEANQYLIRLLKKDVKRQTIYEKAMTSIILNSPTYIQSLKEYTVCKAGMGRYYDTPRAGYSWRDYRIPTQVAAIEALLRLTPADSQTIDEMRQWLLQQKRTQAWDTPLNSVDAVYAFLRGNMHTLEPQQASVVKMDGTAVDLPKGTAGLGYVKTTLPADGSQTLQVEKTSEGTSWGAVYAQFLQSALNVSDSKSGVAVRRELLVADAHGSGLVPLTSQLKVGDRVTVRLTIESERDLDFVQVHDKRAACLEPLRQLSGYQNGYYIAPHDYATDYFFSMLPKGKHVIETVYYVDRPGRYETGTCTVGCAYAPEFRGTAKGIELNIKK